MRAIFLNMRWGGVRGGRGQGASGRWVLKPHESGFTPVHISLAVGHGSMHFSSRTSAPWTRMYAFLRPYFTSPLDMDLCIFTTVLQLLGRGSMHFYDRTSASQQPPHLTATIKQTCTGAKYPVRRTPQNPDALMESSCLPRIYPYNIYIYIYIYIMW